MISRNINIKVTLLVTAAVFSLNSAFAQAPAATPGAPKPVVATAAPPATAPSAAAANKDATIATAEKKANPNQIPPSAAKTAKSKECSIKADEQKLHGKARKKFRSECKKSA